MNFDIKAIFERMKVATNSQNDNQLCKFLGRSSSTVSGWKNGSVPPWTGLYEVKQKTGVSIDWLLTGQEAQATVTQENALIGEYSNFKAAYLRGISLAHELNWIARTDKTTDSTLSDMAEMTFKKFKGIDASTELENTSDKVRKST